MSEGSSSQTLQKLIDPRTGFLLIILIGRRTSRADVFAQDGFKFTDILRQDDIKVGRNVLSQTVYENRCETMRSDFEKENSPINS